MMSWSVKGRLITGLAGLAGLSVAIGVVGWLSIEGINRTLNAITDVSAPTVETSDDLAIRLWEATKVAEEVAAADTEGEIDELIAEFETLMADYDAAEIELYDLIEDPATVALLDAAGTGQEQLVERTRELSDLRREYLTALQSTRQLLEDFDSSGAELNARLSELVDSNETEMTAAEEEGDNLEARSGTAAEVNAVLGELFERDYPMVRAALTLQRQVVELQDTAGEYLAEMSPDALARVEAEFDTLFAAVAPQLDLLFQFAETSADRDAIDDLVGRFDALRAIALDEGMLFAVHRNRTEVARRAEVTLTDLENDADIVAEEVDSITDAADAVSDAADEEAASSVASATALIMVMLGVGLAVALALIVMVIRKVTGPINAMTSAMNRLAAGDTAAEVPAADRRDEIGQMAKAVQVFKDNALEKARLEQESKEREQQAEAEKQRAMQDLADSFDQQVGGILQMVTNQATELQATATQLAAAVEETEAQSGAATAAAGEASTNVQTMASATEELGSAINEVTGQLGNAASQLQATAKGARTAQDRMDELQATIAQIDQVVGAINNVAEQTNLLALNATIEAARAGEAGKGFAVVASEVKMLANSTRQMTESIAQQLDALKAASDGAVNASRSILQDVDSLNQSTTAIASSMEQQSAATTEIGRNAQKAAIGTEEVSSNMDGVQKAATDTSRASDDVHRAASGLGQQAATLQDAVNDFLSGIRAA